VTDTHVDPCIDVNFIMQFQATARHRHLANWELVVIGTESRLQCCALCCVPRVETQHRFLSLEVPESCMLPGHGNKFIVQHRELCDIDRVSATYCTVR